MNVERVFWEREVEIYKEVLIECDKEFKVKVDKLVVDFVEEVEK